jgi:hypothetical protein
LYAYLGIPEAEIILFLPGPSSRRESARSSSPLGDSCPVVELESMMEALTPLVRMGTMDALLELLLLICSWERRYLKHRSIPTASNTPMTTPTVVPMARPSETPFILRIQPQILAIGTMLPPPHGRSIARKETNSYIYMCPAKK